MPKKKPRIGRPPTERGMSKIRGQIRWHEDEWEEIEKAVAKLGVAYSEFAKPLLLREARKINGKASEK